MNNMVSEKKILVVDDELSIRKVLKSAFEDENYSVLLAKDGSEALRKVREFRPDVVLLDIWMPGTIDGMDVLRELQNEELPTQIIMMSGHGNIETAVKATKLGAWDFVEKPVSLEKILILIKNAILFQETKTEKRALLSSLRNDIAIVGHSAETVKLKKTISSKAMGNETLFVSGAKGVGKQLVAKNIHYLGSRSGKPFVEVNMASIPEELLEIELFDCVDENGDEKLGKLSKVCGGTLFLRKVELLSKSTLDKIIKKICNYKDQDNQCFRLIISSDQDDLTLQGGGSEEIAKILVLGLEERNEDVLALISYFSQKYAVRSGYEQKIFSDDAMSFLQNYSWPGNIRELRNFIERVYILVPNELVELKDLEFAGMNMSTVDNDFKETEESDSFKLARAEFEKEFILDKIKENDGNISQTAKVIGLERSYLHRKIKSYGLEL